MVHTSPDNPAGRVPLESERFCFSCGYPLRGLPSCGCCPECGERISFADLPRMSPCRLRELRSPQPLDAALITLVAMILAGVAFIWLVMSG